MPRRVFNWNYNDVSDLLKDNGFKLNHIESSHHFFVGNGDSDRFWKLVHSIKE